MNNDLISRSALKEDFDCVGFNDYDDYNRALRIIDNAPTVEVPENKVNCVLTMFGKCSYNKTGCSDCEIKDKIRKALNERPTGKWIQIPLKTLNGDDIVAYKSSCCGAIADKKYQHCPKCNEKMEVKKNDSRTDFDRDIQERLYR